ncbi:sensor histidine kinase [Deinococcus yavapaiensis]|uniref:histidine kinase n=1 Tax=Deinococcus yavapaiensis KR-236 TaxID=694435 RepID=A0A318S987_9DEIO|nr:HAMP domain-containing sensor histidine kinase [Deinococcus yavapaiensis]PYE54547.1 two-component system sensor histidine kinase MprB [Deinococcus yavapaiensis KR-236]
MSLRWRLVLLSVGLTFSTLLLLGVLVGVLLWRAETQAVEDEVSAQASALASLARRAPGTLRDDAQNLLLREGRASVALVLRDREVLWSGGSDAPESLLRSAPLGVSRQGDFVVARVESEASLVSVARSLASTRRTLERYALTTSLVGLGLVALAGLLTALLVQRVLATLERLEKRVRRLDTPEPVPGVNASDEVGTLARALDVSLTELREQRAREERFLANASHELRTPVAALLADVQHTLSRPRPPEVDRATLKRTERAALRLQDLTANLLTLSRARNTPERFETDLLDLAGDVVDRLTPLAIARGLDLLLDGEPTVARVDAALVTRTLENLVGNALKFTREGEVRVTARPRGEFAELLVEDSGPGLPEGAETLFEPFSRGHTKGEGFGLGLAVVREVVEAHAGRVRFERRDEGGTRVRVVLPR